MSVPQVLLIGLRSSGKTSIRKVVFEKCLPHETRNFETTVAPERKSILSNASIVPFCICDFPGQLDPFAPTNSGHVLDNCGAVVFVIDATYRKRDLDDNDAEERLCETIRQIHHLQKDLVVQVFIHKVDDVSDEQKQEVQRCIEQYVAESGIPRRRGMIEYYFTSIYDHSIFRAFSAVVQRLIRKQQAVMGEMVNMLCTRSSLSCAYVFDKYSRMCLVSNSSASDQQFEILFDVMELVNGSILAFQGSISDDNLDSVFFLTDTVIMVTEVTHQLVLAMEMTRDTYANRALVDYNVDVFRSAMVELLRPLMTTSPRPSA